MATVQIQKTVSTTKTAIDLKQSLEVVQTMLHGSLSSLSYLRNFFAEKAFDEQIYDMDERIHPYEAYAAGQLVKDSSNAKGPATVMKVLRRGRSRRVDVFLDWLENGAFAALQAGNLRALQVYVHADSNDRERVLETYTFTIKYTKDAGSGKALAGLEMDSPGAMVSVQATNSALQTLLRRIMDTCEALPELPQKRFISMELFYLPEAGKGYEPQGFVPGTSDKMAFARAEGWEHHTENLKELISFFHCSSLKISTLIHAKFTQKPLPKILQYAAPTSKRDGIMSDMIDPSEMASRIVNVSNAPSTGDDGSVAATTTPSTVVESEKMPAQPAQRQTFKEPVPTPASTSDPAAAIPQAPSDSQTQVVEPAVNGMKSALQGMMQPEHISQGDTQTQSLVYPPPPVSETTASPSRYTVSPSKLSLAEPVTSDKPCFSPKKAIELQREKQRLHDHAHDIAKRNGRKTKKGDVVLCQCGYNKDEGDMVECTYCNTWQHLHCYGYTGASDPRLPDDHICYQCLMGDEEQATLTKLQALALKRRGMHFALQNGLKNQRDFATDLDLDVTVAGPVYQHLRNMNYVLPVTGSHKAGYVKSGKPLFVATRDGPIHEKMLQSLFDPLMHISHHYQATVNPARHASLTQRLLASQSDMPPPATPASAMRKRNAMTPASGLDLRASMTPFQTPSRPRQSLKRPLNAQESSLSPASVNKRLRSVQTLFVLDANGLPSSPAGSMAEY